LQQRADFSFSRRLNLTEVGDMDAYLGADDVEESDIFLEVHNHTGSRKKAPLVEKEGCAG
jgi:hypothetical protein